MRILALLPLAAMLLATVPARGQKSAVPYQIEFDPARDVEQKDRYENQDGLFLSVRFIITRDGAQVEETGGSKYKLRIEEDGKFVKAVDVPQPKPSEDLAVALAMDISGSMKEHQRMEQARRASGVFFKSLPAKADCGLILFNHKVEANITPSRDRAGMRKLIDAIDPHGGTAYFDATEKAIETLEHSPIKNRAIVLMTDGVDINSESTLERVVARAKKAKIRVFTIGIGNPGRQDLVTSVLVLDKSGSMNLPANDRDKVTKIQALRDAADRFVNSIGSTRKSTIVEFSDAVQTPNPFTNNKFELKTMIRNLTARGETALFDGVYTAVATLDAENPAGKRAVVALTDGIDNSSRRRVEEVIDRAKEAKIPLYLLGFGRKGELDVKTMTRMADETKGQFYHAEDEKSLVNLFEKLSIQLHDDGIDEISLGTLAAQTGGQYYPAKDVSRLDLILGNVTKDIVRKEYQVTFKSLTQARDGVRRRVALKLIQYSDADPNGEQAGGKEVLTKEGGVQIRGLVIAEMHPLVYLVLLAVLGGLIALPTAFKRRQRMP